MKTERAADQGNRREFLRGGIRYSLLAAVGAAVATMLGRRQTRLPGQICVNAGICGGCGVFEDCGLPQALSAKQARSRGSRGNEAPTSLESEPPLVGRSDSQMRRRVS